MKTNGLRLKFSREWPRMLSGVVCTSALEVFFISNILSQGLQFSKTPITIKLDKRKRAGQRFNIDLGLGTFRQTP